MQRVAPISRAPASRAARTSQRAAGIAARHLWPRRRLIVALAFVVGVVATWRATRVGADRGTPSASLAAALATDGLVVDPSTIVWLREDGGPIASRPALLLGHREGDLDDVWYVEAHVATNAAVLDARWLTNVTRTSGASEVSLSRSDNHAIYCSRVSNTIDAITLLSIDGEGGDATRGWGLISRLQNGITNVQETGRMRGLGRTRFAFVDAAHDVSVRAEHAHFVVVADGSRIEIDPGTGRVLAGADRVERRPSEKSQPGGITWIVDTVRNVSWIGAAPIEWMEHVFYGAKDAVVRAQHAVVREDRGQEADEAASALAATGGRHQETGAAVAEDIDWPPPALQPVLPNPLEGEGRWVAVDDDAYVGRFANAPAPFYQTFLRADHERPYTQLFVTVWDPRQLQLHVVMGTREPESATGETGTGLVPRDPQTLSHLVAAFNGGFQALHGEFGMMADGRVYLPPKPWAATLAVYDDGRVGMGSWPAVPLDAEGHYDEHLATQQIPADMIAMRQNLTSVVEGNAYNPWQRWWWGAAPQYAHDQTFTARSGICLTREGYLAYFWGDPMGPDALGAAMLATRCVRGMHLDMNTKQVGMELYRLAPPGQQLPAVATRGDGVWEGALDPFDSGITGWTVRVRKAIAPMDPMRFPRWTRRDPRDFFYLTTKSILPGPDVGATRFTTTGLPQPAWPPAFAHAELGGTTVVRIDRTRAVMREDANQNARRVLGWFTHARTRDLLTGTLLSANSNAGAHAGAAIGVDENGFLVVADGEGARTALSAAGVVGAVVLPDDVRLVFQGDGELDRETDLVLYAEDRPAAAVIFPEVTPMPYSQWGELQDARVRYVPEHHAWRFVRTAAQRAEDPAP